MSCAQRKGAEPGRGRGESLGRRLLVLLAGLLRRVDDVPDLLADRLHLARYRGHRVQIDLAEVDVLEGLRQRDAAQSLERSPVLIAALQRDPTGDAGESGSACE
jgi:hypothetical protein